MSNKLFCIHILISLLTLVKGDTSLYGIDTKDDCGIRIYKRDQSSSTCLLYKSINTRRGNLKPLYLLFSSGHWKILKSKGGIIVTKTDCVANVRDILYQQEGETLYSEGWYNPEKNESDIILSVYAFEECTTFKGAYVNSQNLRGGMILQNGNMDSCLENAFSADWHESISIIVTTKSESMNTVCQFDYITINSGTIWISNDDEQAQFYVGSKNCYTNQILGDSPGITTMHISEAKLHNENLNRLETPENQNAGGFPISAVIGGLGGGAMVVLVLLCVWWRTGFRCCGQRKSGAGKGHYGRASIDSNFQYGDGEYYHYQKANQQTRVVDENELYANYDHE